jgi:hypothetical protein
MEPKSNKPDVKTPVNVPEVTIEVAKIPLKATTRPAKGVVGQSPAKETRQIKSSPRGKSELKSSVKSSPERKKLDAVEKPTHPRRSESPGPQPNIPNLNPPGVAPSPVQEIVESVESMHERLDLLLTPVIKKDYSKVHVKVQQVAELLNKLKIANPKRYAIRLMQCLVRENPVDVGNQSGANLPIEIGLNVRITPADEVSSHPIARYNRALVDRYLLDLAIGLASKNDKAVICDYYGSKRLMHMFDYCKNMIVRNKIPLDVDMHWFRPLVTAKDHVTYSGSLGQWVSAPPKVGTVVIVQDLYNIPPYDWLSNLFELGVKDVLMATMIYTPTAMAGVMFTEGPFEQKDGKFVSAASPFEPPWVPCPANDIWYKQTSLEIRNGFACWTAHRKVEDYHIFKIHLTNQAVEKEDMKYVPDQTVKLVEKDFPTPGTKMAQVLERVRVFFVGPRAKLIVSVDAINQFSHKMVGKNRQPYQITTLSHDIASILEDTTHQAMFRFISIPQARVLADTVTYLTWENFERDLNLLEHVNQVYGLSLDVYRSIKTKMPGDTSYGLLQILGMIVTALLVLKLMMAKLPMKMWDYRGIVSGDMLNALANFITIATAPMIEEKFKQQNGLLGLIYVVWAEISSALRAWSVNTPYYTTGRLVVFTGFKILFHSLANKIHPIFHALWNFVLLNSSEDLLPSSRWGSLVSLPLAFVQPPKLVVAAWVGTTSSYNMYTWWHHIQLLINPFFKEAIQPGYAEMLSKMHTLERSSNRFSEVIFKTLDKIHEHMGLLISAGLACYYHKRGGQPPSVSGTVKAHSDFVFLEKDTDVTIIQWQEAVKHHKQKTFELEKALPLTYNQAIVPSNLMTNVNYSPFPVNIYDHHEKPACQFVVATSPAIFERPVGIFHFYQALHSRNLAPAKYLARCEDKKELPRCKMYQFNPLCKVSCNWQKTHETVKEHMRPRVLNVVTEQSHIFEIWRMKRQDWVKHFGAAMQRVRAAEAVEMRKEGFVLPVKRRSTVFLKSDEVLCPKDDVIPVKGRLIKAVHPTIQADCAVQIDMAMKKLKSCVQTPFQLRTWNVLLSIGSGRNASSLSKWFTKAHYWCSYGSKRAAFIFAGDDTFFMVHREGSDWLFGEIDFSKFDRTQGVHALTVEACWLYLFGVKLESIIKMNEAILADAVYEEKVLDFREKIKMPPQRATGGPDTTWGNTMNNIGVAMSFFIDRYPFMVDEVNLKDLPEWQARHGFESKYKDSPTFLGLTFLKGSFFPIEDYFVWLPLPSQAIKIGKIMTDPRVIYKGEVAQSAWCSAAYSLASGVGTIPRGYPILGPLIHFYLYKGIKNEKKLKENLYRAEFDMTIVVTDSTVFDEFLFNRYGITKEETLMFEAELEALYHVPFPILFSSNPLWSKLWLDYS